MVRSLLVCFFGIFVAYSICWGTFGRLAGLPVSYLPFLLVFSGFVALWLISGSITIYRSEIWLLAITIYLVAQPVILAILGQKFSFSEYAMDITMLATYFVSYVAVSTVVSRLSPALKLKILEKAVALLVVATSLGLLRFVFIDSWVGGVDFINIVPPLQYRFFEVLLFIFGFSISAYQYLITKKTKHKCFMLLFLIGVVVSGSRTGMLSILFASYLIFLSGTHKVQYKSLLIPIVLLGVALTFALLIDNKVTERMSRISEVTLFAKLDLDGALEEKKNVKRILYLSGGLEMLADYPLFGVGLGNFQEQFPSDLMNVAGTDHVARPHNMYVSFLATTGLVGTILFFGWLFNIFLEIRRRGSDNSIATGKFALLYKPSYVFMLTMFVFFLGYEVETNPVYWGIMGILTGVARNNFYARTSTADAQGIMRGDRG